MFRFIHREGSPHKYAVSWTTMQDPQLRKQDGGHFFMCSHGIKVTAAPDTVVAQQPKFLHGTSLQCRDPYNPTIFQAGLAIVTPAGINNLWADVQEKKVRLEEARRKMQELDNEEQ
jgi:hypothetical protein